MTRQCRILSKRFCEGDHPLEQCMSWVSEREKESTQRFIIFAHEVQVGWSADTQRVIRQYEAIDNESGLRQWCRNATKQPRHAHEVIHNGPVRLYVDIDVAADDPFHSQAADACATFVKGVQDDLARTHNAVCTVLELDATVPGGKFSRHIIVDMKDATTPSVRVAFQSAKDCGAYVQRVQQQCGFLTCLRGGTPLCDAAVYRRNGTLRMFGNTKFGQNRPLRLVSDSGSNAFHTIPLNTLRQSLVHIIRNNVEQFRIISVVQTPSTSTHTSTVLGKRSIQQGEAETERELFTDALYDSVQEIADAMPKTVKVTDTGEIFVKCTGKQCRRKPGRHKSNTVFFLIDPKFGRYRQYCYDPECKKQPVVPWCNISDTVKKLGIAYVQASKPRAMRTYNVGIASTITWST